ncbi:hypothetical protein BL250_03825 [Erwinia sp. OLTSP20]|uniref:aldo/keto reductase n=1 Tax=unclassified Erwinia TaxID=2622719 RepID=UPI000C18F956|nr:MULTISPECIES: aldo/keto reductase [unclassified Erwinia]PIJ51631.1 hypothetical protein BV501_02755 [Erwinia sp. OAMSP11]PIJ69708.1 hypothetical protein BK416_14010 [Erwinia sp. OLSSP12]PIJ79431.1 hypothetical protein BLD47_14090 [Erwinia sp. OLCASP19]PIJ86601.1 hypothetical protein BLD46_02580 [Erwinia sp. OLMTSP26]PIJ88042.1 hypothetical protein BLD49_03260 [Erwinia sp. OLMDSP33]
MDKCVTFADGETVPAIGQGSWYMGEQPAERSKEIAALQQGLDLGLNVIDTAEMYADGGAERVVGDALNGRRHQAFLVSKVYPWNAGRDGAIQACERSLRRLKTDYLDLYLLHWRGNVPVEETRLAMETLVRQGKIRRWGVSNFDSQEMQMLWQIPGGEGCATNQVLYHLASRGIEYDLLPACQQHQMPLMAYCPLAQAGRLRNNLLQHPVLQQMACENHISVAQLLLAWVIRQQGVLAIPKASTPAHVAANAAALTVSLTPQEWARLDPHFPPPPQPLPLDIV